MLPALTLALIELFVLQLVVIIIIIPIAASFFTDSFLRISNYKADPYKISERQKKK